MSAANTNIVTVTAPTDSALRGLVADHRWDGPITYAFPTSRTAYGSNYGDGENNNSFGAINAGQITAAIFALDADIGGAAAAGFSVEGFTTLDIRAGAASNSTIRAGTSNVLGQGEAYAYLPFAGENESGDIWFQAPESAQVGNYGWFTMLHEIGHALGLEHAHEGPRVPAQFDHIAYTIMSYRAYQGGSVQGAFPNGEYGYAQSFMMYDIAALQYMYGANFTINSGDTVYSWTPSSGDTRVNGSIGINAVQNYIFATIWDGGGIDTYDLSAYTTALTLSLAAGGHSLFRAAQAADLGNGNTPDGNIYNALMHLGNTASLIENAIGGSGADTITGNEVSNVLTGNGGNDILDGGAGIDYASYNGLQANYTITQTANGYTISGGADGTDTLTNIEFARFSDGDVELSQSMTSTDFTENSDNSTGTSGADNIDALGGNDTVDGLGGDDIINGGAGNDTLLGNVGNDILIGGAGRDTLNGGGGVDTASYEGATNRVSVSLLTNSGTVGQAIGDTLISIENLTGSGFGDTLRGNNSRNVLMGEDGKDTLIGFGGNDRIFGGDGRDIITGGDGADYINGGAGIDQARYNGSDVAVHIDLLAGTATGGHAQGDTLVNIENLFGSNHNDTLYGDSNNNKIFGHNGDDALAGGGGISRLYGGSGNDSFVLSDGFAFVMDFVDDVDQLDVSDYGFATLADALMNLDQVGNHARFRMDGDVLFVLNTDMNDLMDDIVI